MTLEKINSRVKPIEVYARKLICQLEDHSFHNIHHTENVVKWVKKLGWLEGVPSNELVLLEIAAWLHDLGFTQQYCGHEACSVSIMVSLLEQHFSKSEIASIKSMILATRLPQQPKNKLESIICDADLAHLGDPNYLSWLDRLRHEWQVILGLEKTEKEWQELNIDFLSNHQYHTHAARRLLAEGKLINIRKLQSHPAAIDQT